MAVTSLLLPPPHQARPEAFSPARKKRPFLRAKKINPVFLPKTGREVLRKVS